MILPTVHLNGTGIESLMAQYNNAYYALTEAIRKMAAAAPNGRDYYLQGPGVWQSAVAEHEDRMKRVQAVMEEIGKIGEYLGDEELKRMRR